jgi:hypothetical protein
LGAVAVAAALAQLLPRSAARAQPEPIQIRPRCYDCHLNPNPPAGTERGPYVDFSRFKRSTHGGHRCESCHRAVVDLPHARDLPPVECRDCHRLDNTAGAPELPSYREYERSVHGRLAVAGDPKAPRCQDCHGDHDILRPTDPESHVNRFVLAETCGKCHRESAARYRMSSHAKAIEKGYPEAPVCSDCHGEHLILAPEESESSISRAQIVTTCATCHEDITRMKLFGIDPTMVEAYRESYHGVASKFGSAATATCVDCHGHHDVLGPEDPKSTVHPANVPATCGRAGCHEGAGPGFARGRVHVSVHATTHTTDFPEGRDRTFAKVIRIVELAFIALTTSVLFSMILYMAFDLFYRWVRLRGKWARYVAVVTVPLGVTFWAVIRVAQVFVEKLRS